MLFVSQGTVDNSLTIKQKKAGMTIGDVECKEIMCNVVEWSKGLLRGFLAVGVYFNKLLYSDKPSAYSWTLHTNIGQLDITMANE